MFPVSVPSRRVSVTPGWTVSSPVKPSLDPYPEIRGKFGFRSFVLHALGYRRQHYSVADCKAACDTAKMVACNHNPVGKERVLLDITVDMPSGKLLLTHALQPVEVCNSIENLHGLKLSNKNLVIVAHSASSGGPSAFR